MALLDLVML